MAEFQISLETNYTGVFGQDVNLDPDFTYNFIADSSGIISTFPEVTFFIGKGISQETVSYQTTHLGANLILSEKLLAEFNSFNLNGLEVGLILQKNQSIQAEQGQFEIQLNDVNFGESNYVIIAADSQAFNFIGFNTGFDQSSGNPAFTRKILIIDYNGTKLFPKIDGKLITLLEEV